MKTNYTIYLVFLSLLFNLNAQTTSIPDSRFEQKLIDLGLDDVRDHSVLTANIADVKTLSIVGLQNQEINDLTGIEDFASLEELHCNLNKLTSLDLSNNTNLVKLICSQNLLTSIDLSGCLNLSYLVVDLNFLPVLDLSANTKLTYLKCFSNSLKMLDLSSNPMLYYLRCSANPLTALNIKNGNNGIITSFDARNNNALTCIQVDNESLANSGAAPYTNWRKDALATYSEDCRSLGVADELFDESLKLFPNPADRFISIKSDIIPLERIDIFSMTGQRVKAVTSNFKHILITDLTSGVFVLKITSKHSVIYRRLIKK